MLSVMRATLIFFGILLDPPNNFVGRAGAFSPSILSNVGNWKRVTDTATSRPSKPLAASVYYPDGESYLEDDDIFGSSSYMQSAQSVQSPLLSQLAERLTLDPQNTPILARLAAAFSPPGFTINLQHIHQVKCLSVDNKHLEIEAVVCDDVECSSLLVPVNFPEECSLDNLEECILSNVSYLDREGEQVIREREEEAATFAEEGEAMRAYETLQSVGGIEVHDVGLPGWWVPPRSSEDASESELLQQLLNGQDLEDVVHGLATQTMRRNEVMGESDVLQRAHVKAIGPAGMILEAQMALCGRTWRDEGGLNNVHVHTVYVPFEGGPIEDGSRSIREEVLQMVSSVNAF